MSASPEEIAPSDEQFALVIARRSESETAMQAAKDACGQLYLRHGRKLLAFLAARVYRSDLEDVHQGVWERVWQNLPTGFHGGNFRAWLHQIARNYVIDLSRKKRLELYDPEKDFSDERRAAPDDQLVEQERAGALKGCLQNLTSAAADLVRARLSGEGYDEICSRLGLKAAQAHKMFHQAKEQLRDCVERKLK